jgi:cytochrome b pre-mRNA-processing protein 3
MLNLLFPRLTAAPEQDGTALFDAITAAARQPHWYVEGEIPDTLDGRFRVLATLTALATVRLEAGEAQGNALSAALTERFVAVMEAEHRELGLGDPGLGRKVQKLVGSLAGRVELWRSAAAEANQWREAANRSLYQGSGGEAAMDHSADALETFWGALNRADVSALSAGRLA